MALSKETRIKIFIAIDVIFFLLEIVIGYVAHSLALVADAFHMLNDVISLCVGLWAVRVATKRSSSPEYTYGWARAELLGGLVNGVFLVALCMTIFLDAIERFFDPQEVTQPKLVLVVGSVGLVFNILGLFVFHQHSHSHGEEDAGHSHEHADELHAAEQGQSAPHSHTKQVADSVEHVNGTGRHTITWDVSQDKQTAHHASPVSVRARSSSNRASGRQRSASRSQSVVDSISIHPASLRNDIRSYATNAGNDSEDTTSDYEREEYEADEEAVQGDEAADEPTEVAPLLGKGRLQKLSSRNSRPSHPKSKQADLKSGGNAFDHSDHTHNQPKPHSRKGGHGHSHDDMNIRGMFLHVLGDALGNVGVIATALIIWLTTWPGRFYFDPAISLIITAIILKTAIPLCKDTAKPLLQAVPGHISIDNIRKDVENLPGVRSCHHIHVWALTPARLIATLDVELDFDFEGKNAAKYMVLANEIKKCLHEHGIHSSTIQPEFCTNETHAHAVTSGFQAANTGDSRTSSTTMVPATVKAPDVIEAARKMKQGGCGNGECLLDCKDSCCMGKQCCGPNDGKNGGKNGASKDAPHDSDHGHDHEH